MSAVRTRVPPLVTETTAVSVRAAHDPAQLQASLPAVRERRVRRVLEIIDAEPARSVRELAQEVRLSPAHLERLFKQKVGSRVRDFIVEFRLQRAAGLLSKSDLSIKEIAHSVGYGHHSSFVRAFQKRFSEAPKRYREHHEPEGDSSVLAFSKMFEEAKKYR